MRTTCGINDIDVSCGGVIYPDFGADISRRAYSTREKRRKKETVVLANKWMLIGYSF